MNSRIAQFTPRVIVWLLVSGGLFLTTPFGHAQSVAALARPQLGGRSTQPVITAIERGSNGVVVRWEGPPSDYQLYKKTSLSDTVWQPVGSLTKAKQALVSDTSALFRVAAVNTSPYGGAAICSECHGPVYSTFVRTPHFSAFNLLRPTHQQSAPACLPCHTVGYGRSSGFVSEAATPGLVGVQCESCHGPAANHAANDGDPTIRPPADQSATVCGGCHSGRYPSFDEWKTSGHAKSLVCVTCHDPHQTTANPKQLRSPLAAICQQCHHTSGVTWTNLIAPPPTGQYNLLAGTLGEMLDGSQPNYPATHVAITNQCIGCHMQTTPFQDAAHPADTGHSLKIQALQKFALCLECHPWPDETIEFTKSTLTNQIAEIKGYLDLWATRKAPSALWSKYNVRSWEYPIPGALSSGGAGPTAVEQALIPVNIRKARFNLYLTVSDRSYGVHNPEYFQTLLEAAETWIKTELNK